METTPDTLKPSRKPIVLFFVANCAIIVAVSLALVSLLGDDSPSSHPALSGLTSQAPVKQALPLPVPAKDGPLPSPTSIPHLPGLPNVSVIPTPPAALQSDRLPPGDPDLFRAVWTGNTDEVQRLLQAGTQANVSDEDGDPFLHEAIWRGHPEIVTLLINAGADVNATAANGDSLLEVARWYHRTEIEQILLASGATN